MKVTTKSLGSITLLGTALAACSGSSPGLGVGVIGGTGSPGNTGTQGGSAATGGKSSHSTSASAGGTIQVGSIVTGGASAAGGATTVGGGATTAADCRQDGDGKTTLLFVNHCAQAVTFRGSDITGGTLAAGAVACVDVGNATEAIPSKRYWGYTGSDPGAERHTLAEFTFNSDFYDLDWYNISHVDAHNLPMAILPSARPKCRRLSCPQDFLASCPMAGQYRDATGEVVACVSPDRDDPNNPVVLLFEQCSDAYAWSGDDQQGSDVSPMIGCEVEDFDIVFCPEPT